jgi:hypothetical protein
MAATGKKDKCYRNDIEPSPASPASPASTVAYEDGVSMYLDEDTYHVCLKIPYISINDIVRSADSSVLTVFWLASNAKEWQGRLKYRPCGEGGLILEDLPQSFLDYFTVSEVVVSRHKDSVNVYLKQNLPT